MVEVFVFSTLLCFPPEPIYPDIVDVYQEVHHLLQLKPYIFLAENPYVYVGYMFELVHIEQDLLRLPPSEVTDRYLSEIQAILVDPHFRIVERLAP